MVSSSASQIDPHAVVGGAEVPTGHHQLVDYVHALDTNVRMMQSVVQTLALASVPGELGTEATLALRFTKELLVRQEVG